MRGWDFDKDVSFCGQMIKLKDVFQRSLSANATFIEFHDGLGHGPDRAVPLNDAEVRNSIQRKMDTGSMLDWSCPGLSFFVYDADMKHWDCLRPSETQQKLGL